MQTPSHDTFQPIHHSHGLTLIELCVVLAISAIVLAISLPAISSMDNRNRMKQTLNLIVTQLALARSEAVKNHLATILCPSTDGLHCSGGYDWNQGFILYRDDNRNRAKEDAEPVLNRFERITPEIRVTTTVGRPQLLYHPDGSARGYNATLTLCDLTETVEPRTIILSNSGRVRVSETDASGAPPVCP